ncbi:MAG: hypothetical protein HGA75_07725 [Thiobacillus sp.]|nr:hypothetical protein [Thiobacillus sp.]
MLIATLSGQASAAVIDFNSLLTATTNPFVSVTSPYIEDGFKLTTVAGASFTYGGEAIYATTAANANWTGSPGVYSGTNAYYGSAFLLERVDGGTFDLVSMDAASFWSNNANAQNFNVYGYPDAGGFVHQNFTLDSSTNTLQTLIFNDGFKGLDKIIFSSVYAQVDNINLRVAAVPLPPSLALMLPGLGLLGFLARRGKAA